MTSPSSASLPLRPLLLLAVGTFAIGTEGFMIAPLLPAIARDLKVSVSAAGQLVSAFAFVYALSSPVLTALTANLERRLLLGGGLALFCLSNLAGWGASTFLGLMLARIAMAIGAGVYVPSANATAGMLVPEALRTRALAIISGGQSTAIAIGVPMAASVGDLLGWRVTFLGVALLAAAGVVGIFTLLPELPLQRRRFSTAHYLALLRRPGIFGSLSVTMLWAIGAYTMLTYLAEYLRSTLGVHGATVGYFMFAWGAAAVIGVFVSGMLSDRFGARHVIVGFLALLAAAFASLSLTADLLSATAAWVPVIVAIVVWGMSVWGFFPPQQSRLIGLAGADGAPIVLSINASFMYLGFAVGSALGGLVLAHGSVSQLGWVAAGAETIALVLMIRSPRHEA